MTQSTNHNFNIKSVTKGQGTYDLFVTDDNRYSIEFSKIDHLAHEYPNSALLLENRRASS